MRLSAVGGWSLVSLTTVSTCRLMEVSSAEQYLCSLEGNLLEELEDTQQVFVASLVLSDVLTGGRGSNKFLFTLKSSVADPDPGSGAFLTHGSGMNNPDHISSA